MASCCCVPQYSSGGGKQNKYNNADILQFFTGGKVTDITSLSELVKKTTTPPVETSIPLVTDIGFLQTLDEIFIENVEFIAFDFSDDNFGNLMDGLHQPNFFQPKIRVNGTNLIQVTNSIVGIPLPYCHTINKVVKHPSKIEILATFAKYENNLYTSYPIQALMKIYHNN